MAPSPDQGQWMQVVDAALAAAPDPDRARALSAELLQAGASAGLELQALAEDDPHKLAELLRSLCGVAPFFVSYLRRRPQWLLALLRQDLSAPRQPAQFEAAIAAVCAQQSSATDALRMVKYEELARITARDCSERWVPLARVGEALRELSDLADALLQRALQQAAANLCERFGPARWRGEDGGEVALAFAVLGLGKLGAQELNYSSDVDLVYVYEAPPGELDDSPRPGYALLPPAEYFTRLGQVFGGVVCETTAEGFLYRIDLDLRPDGAQGPLVVSDQTLTAYHESWADTWEKATFMKARPVAGDIAFGWRTIRALDPMIYRSTMDYAAVESIQLLKDKIEAAHGRRAGGFNVKLDRGGIRDIEFVSQALQLLHGGRIEQVRSRGAEDALERLRDVRLLSSEQAAVLLAAYRFMRRLENRLQMVAEQQTHWLRAEPEERLRIARSLGYTGQAGLLEFDGDLARHRENVRRVVEALFSPRAPDRIFQLFARNVSPLLASSSSRQMLEWLSEHFAREIERSPHPERALNNLDRFIHAVGQRRFYFELLLDRPELVPRLTALFSASSYLSAVLARHPRLIEPVFYDPNRLLLDKPQLRADFDEILDECRAGEDYDGEPELSALRRFCHRQSINVGLLDLGGQIGQRELESALSDIAEVALERALSFAEAWLRTRRGGLHAIAEGTQFIVVGMGKLASRELAYGSDLDLIFIFDADESVPWSDLVEAQEYCTRLTQRLFSLLQTGTSEGHCYEIDARLRPSGNQGALVSSITAFERYHEKGAQVWERMALLRARSVCGDARLAARFEQVRTMTLCLPLPEDALAEVVHVRRRMERELAKESQQRRDFKRGRGGMLDVENVVQYLQLRHGGEHEELLVVAPIDVQLERLATLGLVGPDLAAPLLAGWRFLQRLSSRLRVVENRSISDLDAEHGDLDGVAETLGYPAGEREGGARRALLLDYRRHTEAIRAAYDRILS